MMIQWLSGELHTITPTGLILNVNGVGYGLEMPLSSLCHLPGRGQKLDLWVYTLVREDAIRLFGFLSARDRNVFDILLGLNGVGPKMALAILSTLSIEALKKAVMQEDQSILSVVPGIGPRMAEKIIVELKPKLSKLSSLPVNDVPTAETESARRMGPAAFDSPLGLEEGVATEGLAMEEVFADIESALENLGFKDKAIAPLIAKLRKESPTGAFQDLMKRALLEISQNVGGRAVQAGAKPGDKKSGLDTELF